MNHDDDDHMATNETQDPGQGYEGKRRLQGQTLDLE